MPPTPSSTRVVEALKPDMLQLHGKETPERVAAVRSRFGLPVMKALPVETARRSVADPRSTPRSPTGCCSMAMAQTAISTAPAAPSMWPVAPLVELTASFLACSPKTVLIACVSQTSPCGVEVPWALM